MTRLADIPVEIWLVAIPSAFTFVGIVGGLSYWKHKKRSRARRAHVGRVHAIRKQTGIHKGEEIMTEWPDDSPPLAGSTKASTKTTEHDWRQMTADTGERYYACTQCGAISWTYEPRFGCRSSTSSDIELPPKNDGDNFMDELRTLINKYSKENSSDTPDYILAEYLNDCLAAWDKAIGARRNWYSEGSEHEAQPGSPLFGSGN